MILPLPDGRPELADWTGREIIMGIRPEAITRAAANDNVASFDCVIDVLEPTGADTLAIINLGGKEVTARLSPRDVVPAGQTMRLSFKMEEVSLFDPETTNRI